MGDSVTKYLRFLKKVHCRDTALGDPDWFEVGDVIPELSVEKYARLLPQKLVDEGKAVWWDKQGDKLEKIKKNTEED
jgi:hypothetical protein